MMIGEYISQWELNLVHFIKKAINFLIAMADEQINFCFLIMDFVLEITNIIA